MAANGSVTSFSANSGWGKVKLGKINLAFHCSQFDSGRRRFGPKIHMKVTVDFSDTGKVLTVRPLDV